MSKTKDVPVYLFTGFLEAGKTKFIQETLEDKRFCNGEKTLLLDGGEGTARETQRRLSSAGLLEEGRGELVIRNSLPGQRIIDLCYTLLKQGSEA